MTEDLIIIGASGLGREVAWTVERINGVCEKWNLIGFLDDNPEINGTIINGYPVLGNLDYVNNYPDVWYACAIGSASARKNVIEKLSNVKFATLIDPSALFSNTVSIGCGTIIGAYSVIGVNANIGKYVLIRTNDMIGHDSKISDFATIYPSVSISGADEIGECSEIGVGTKIIQTKKIGKDTIIGAGSVVIKDIPDNCTAVGSPAKPIKFNTK